MRSILEQTRQADEVIIVDDGSTDDTSRILQSFGRQHSFRIIRLPEKSGFTAAINAGLDACRCDWIARLDADDWWESNHLETIRLALAQADKDTSLVATRAMYWNDEHHKTGESCGPIHGDALRCFMINDNPFVHSATVFRLEAARQAGGYPGGVRWEDYGLWIALMSTGNGQIVDTTTVNCRKQAGSLSAVSKLAALRSRLEMQRKAWRLFRHCCPLTGSIELALTWVRVFLATARRMMKPDKRCV